jgi:hypothetical protein
LDVANTDSAPVNCLKVNILFLLSGIFTDTIILAGNADIMDENIIAPIPLTD